MITAVPVALPVTTPVVEPISATGMLLLLHVPPGVLLSVVVRPRQTVVGAAGVKMAGNGCTVTILVLEHPSSV